MTIRTDKAYSVEDMRETYTEYYGAERANQLIEAMKAMESLDVELSVSVILTTLRHTIANCSNSPELVYDILDDLSDMLIEALKARVEEAPQQDTEGD